MGILGLARLVADVAPDAIKEVELKSYFGRRIAIDASMSLYQFMIAIRHQGTNYMTNDDGETTSHIVGFFYRTCKLLENGIKPVYVFDGKPPKLKGGELAKRLERRKEAESKLETASGPEEVAKYTKRLVRVGRKHNDDVKQLLRLMGLPVVESPSEAEAQCAQLVKEGLVYAVATEDMDALTFGATKLIRNFSSGTGDKVKEFDYHKVLSGLGLTHDQFIDLSILMGCDYCDRIRGIGPKKGLELIRSLGSIEKILETKFGITEFIQDVEVTYRDRVKEQEEREAEEKRVKEEKENGQSVLDKIKERVKEETDKLNKKEVDQVEDDEEAKDESKDETKENGNGDSKGETTEVKKEEDMDEYEIIKEEMPESPHPSEDEKEDTEPEEEGDVDEEEEEKGKKKGKGKGKKPSKGPKEANPKDVPENWLFVGARKLFKETHVDKDRYKDADLKVREPDEEGLIKFLCTHHGFSEDRVRAALKRIKGFKQKSSQSRIDSFFKSVPKESPQVKKVEPAKRKTDIKKETTTKKGKKGK